MVAALTLLASGDTTRRLYLYDTFQGMSEPTDKDRKADNEDAREKWLAAQKDDRNEWCYASQEEVRHNLMSTGYPENRMVFVSGKSRRRFRGRSLRRSLFYGSTPIV